MPDWPADVWELFDGARVVDLSQPMRTGMPQSPNHPPFRMTLERRHGDVVRADGGSAANEIIVTGGHVGTHVDALAHVSQQGMLYGSRDARALQGNEGFTELGIDAFPPYAGRAVLLDVARVHGVATLAPGYEITVEDLERASAEVSIRPGDAVLVATGWSRLWRSREEFVGVSGGAPAPVRRRDAGWPHTGRGWSAVRRSRSSTWPPDAVTRPCRSTASCWSSRGSTSSRRCGSTRCWTPG